MTVVTTSSFLSRLFALLVVLLHFNIVVSLPVVGVVFLVADSLVVLLYFLSFIL